MAFPRYRKARAHKFLVVTSGTGMSALTGTSKTAIDSPNKDLSLAASIGDTVEVGFNGAWDADSSGGQGVLDVATIVSSAAVNWCSNYQGTGFGGIMGTYGPSDASFRHPISGRSFYTIQAGDLSAGKVTLRPYYVVTGGTKNLWWGGNTPFLFLVKNIGPVSPY